MTPTARARRFRPSTDELEVKPADSVRARIDWGPHLRVTPKLRHVPATRNAIYALFRNGRLFYVGSSRNVVRQRLLDRILNAYQLGVDLRRTLRGLTLRIGVVDGGRASEKTLRSVERVLVRNALAPPAGARPDVLRNRNYFRVPFTVSRGGVSVQNHGADLRFLHQPLIERRAGDTMELD